VENALDAVSNVPIKDVYLSFAYEAGRLSIEVRDTGIGVDPAIENRIFEMGISNKSGERGVGLHLVKLSLERLNGWIEYRRLKGETIFHVSVPYESAGEAR
jgi:CitB family two-component system sensor histidine kinase MalK